MSKPFTNLETQVEILKSRGVIFDDEEDAKAKLYKYGYYNLINGYKSLFIARTLPSEIYMPGTKFDYFLIAHDIDFAYRQIILSRIIGIENSLKSIVAYEFAKEFGAMGYTNQANFSSRLAHDCQQLQRKISKIIQVSLSSKMKHDPSFQCVIHYYNTYGEIPIWILFRVMYLGQFIEFYHCLQNKTKNTICRHLSDRKSAPIDRQDLYTFLKILEGMRNMCAHGQRVYSFRTRQSLNVNIPYLQKLLRVAPSFDIHSCNVIIPIFYQLLDEKEFYSFADDIINAWMTARRKVPQSVFSDLLDKILGRCVFTDIIEYMMNNPPN